MKRESFYADLPAYGVAKEALGKARCPNCCGLLIAAALQNSLYCLRCDDLIHKSEWVVPS